MLSLTLIPLVPSQINKITPTSRRTNNTGRHMFNGELGVRNNHTIKSNISHS